MDLRTAQLLMDTVCIPILFAYAIADLDSCRQSTTGNVSSSSGAVSLSVAGGPAKISSRASTTGINHCPMPIKKEFSNMVFRFLATCTTAGTKSQVLSTTVTSVRIMERTRMAQRSMSVGPNTPCLIIRILPGPKKYFRDAQGSSGLITGGEQFCNYSLARAKKTRLHRSPQVSSYKKRSYLRRERMCGGKRYCKIQLG